MSEPRIDWFPSPEIASGKAFRRFHRKGWRWWNNFPPSQEDILASFQSLAADVGSNDTLESGRLIVENKNGKFRYGVERT